MSCRHLLIVLGDQLATDSVLFRRQRKARDIIWMAEVAEESTKVWSNKSRIALFLSAMRHFARLMNQRGWTVDYQSLGDHDFNSLPEALADAISRLQPEKVRVVEPGEYEIEQALKKICIAWNIELEILEDTHFLISHDDFGRWDKTRKTWVLEYFYRMARQKTGYLMNGSRPTGDQWNFDRDNRRHFGKKGPGLLPQPISFKSDAITKNTINLVEENFRDHTGNLETFDWPVTHKQAQQALSDFIEHRLPVFGTYQDAMWTRQPWLYHSRLAAALNLKLLDPRTVLEAAITAYEEGHAPLNAVEGFVRQILGWREYIRHIYKATMPGLLGENALEANEPLPAFYWSGKTEMVCLEDALHQTLQFGYAHHIQRLMVTGLFGLLLGVNPRAMHEWYLAVYVDAVEWVEAPNTLGMSQYADGGRLASKPYVASGKYIQRMSNYCTTCPYSPERRTGPEACPFTTLYWDFLARHKDKFSRHPRTALQWKNLQRLSETELDLIRKQAAELRSRFGNAAG